MYNSFDIAQRTGGAELSSYHELGQNWAMFDCGRCRDHDKT